MKERVYPTAAMPAATSSPIRVVAPFSPDDEDDDDSGPAYAVLAGVKNNVDGDDDSDPAYAPIRAPLASMEDLSVLATPSCANTPMSTPGQTPGASPRSARARWARVPPLASSEPIPEVDEPPSDNAAKSPPPYCPPQQQQVHLQQPSSISRFESPARRNNLLKEALMGQRYQPPANSNQNPEESRGEQPESASLLPSEAAAPRHQVQFLTPRKQVSRLSRSRDSSRYRVHAAEQVELFQLDEEPPTDRYHFIYLIMVLHGVGTLMPWNIFINANEYFVEYKLSPNYTGTDTSSYTRHLLHYLTFAAQVPGVIFAWINVFLNVGHGGDLAARVVLALAAEVVVFVATVVLAMVDSSEWPGLFFQVTILSVVVLNMVNGIYQNSIYGVAARLPFKYTGAVVLGSYLCGTIVSLINIACLAASPDPRTAAIYYFITALFILLACFDTYFVLPLNRFYRYHDRLHYSSVSVAEEKKAEDDVGRIPYCQIFCSCLPQCFNVFFTYFTTLLIFPSVLAEVHLSDPDFFLSPKYYSAVTCFLTFNLFAVLGNLLPSLFRWPCPRFLFLPVVLRFVILVPFFLLCNYHPVGVAVGVAEEGGRAWPVLFRWDLAYWAGVAVFGLTGGHFSAVAMMHCPGSVSPRYSAVAGMFGAASIVSGILAGISCSYLVPVLVSRPELAFDAPEWWP